MRPHAARRLRTADLRLWPAQGALFACLMLAPLPFGSSEPAVIAGWVLWLAAGLCVAAVTVPFPAGAGPRVLDTAVLLLVGAYAFVVYRQITAATVDPVWSGLDAVLGLPAAGTPLPVRDAPLLSLGRPIAYALALALGIVVGGIRHAAWRLVRLFAWGGVVYALYAILSHVFTPEILLWRPKEAYLAYLTGTFINRNTAATFFGSVAAVHLVLFAGDAAPAVVFVRRAFAGTARRLPRALRPAAAHLAGFGLCTLALLMTGSRAGVLISVLVFMVALLMRLPPGVSGLRRGLAVAGFGAASLGVALHLVGTIGARIEAVGLGDLGRLDIYRATLGMVRDHPWIGAGLGSFPLVFPVYRLDEASHYGIVDRVHSTPLEMAAELGVPLTALLVLAWVVALLVILRAALSGGRRSRVCAAVFVVALLGSLHSLIDFSLQIAGYGLPVFGLVGVGLGRAVAPMRRRPARGTRDPGGSARPARPQVVAAAGAHLRSEPR